MIEVFVAGQYEDGIATNSSWSTGDWNADGDFTSGDRVAAFQGDGYEMGQRAVRAVPEPAPLAMLLVGLIGIAAHSRSLINK